MPTCLSCDYTSPEEVQQRAGWRWRRLPWTYIRFPSQSWQLCSPCGNSCTTTWTGKRIKKPKNHSHRTILKGETKTPIPEGAEIKLPEKQAPFLSALIKPHVTIISTAFGSHFQLSMIYSDLGKSAKSAFAATVTE